MPRYPTYDLVAFDADGRERTDDPSGLMSDLVLRKLAADDSGITDVFLLSHGWLGDLTAARAQYDRWVALMAASRSDVARMHAARPGFQPHVVGVHWPSMPWGDESFADIAGPDPVARVVDEYATRIADTPAARDALRRITTSALDNADPSTLPSDVADAYRKLNVEARLGTGGVGSRPGGDRAGFDPEGVYQSLRAEGSGGGLFGVLRTLSYWRMKDRARWFGETAASQLLARMMQAAPRNLRFHLVGHSFGCIVLSGALVGPKGRGRVARPVDSLALVQGALSVWAFCTEIPARPGQPGYYSAVFADRRVRGPVVATQSPFDTATGKWFALGSGARPTPDIAPGDIPKYGAIGTYGVRGPGTGAADLALLPAAGDYEFAPGRAYNLESSAVLRGDAAHSDICHPELAHAVWQAAVAAG